MALVIRMDWIGGPTANFFKKLARLNAQCGQTNFVEYHLTILDKSHACQRFQLAWSGKMETISNYLYQGASINHVDSWGGGVSKMTTLLHKPYLVKISTKGGGVSKNPKIWPRVLWIPPKENEIFKGWVANVLTFMCIKIVPRFFRRSCLTQWLWVNCCLVLTRQYQMYNTDLIFLSSLSIFNYQQLQYP